MNMQGYQPTALRVGNRMPANSLGQGLSPQGCNIFRCAEAVARCARDRDPIRCILDIAPNCRDCLP